LSYIQLTDGVKFTNLNTFSLYDSSIVGLGSDYTKFDASHFNNIAQLRKVSFNESTGKISSYSSFTFEYTNIEKIVNLNWNGTGNRLFYMCMSLQSISGTLNISTNFDYAFWRCL